MMKWYLPKLLAIFLSRDVLVNPRQKIFFPFTIVLSGLGMPRYRSRYLPCLVLALSFLANFYLLYCSSCFLTTPMTVDIFSYQLFLRSWFIFLQVQLPVQRQTKHLRAEYCYYGLNFCQTALFSRSSAISYSINDRIFVAAIEFFQIAQFIHCTYFSCYFLSAVANFSISPTALRAFLFLRSGNRTSSILAWQQWIWGSTLMFSMMLPSASRGSTAFPSGSGMSGLISGWFVQPICYILQSDRLQLHSIL